MKTTEFSFILKPSSISGIGVFAANDIPKGTHIFKDYPFRKMKIKDVPQEFLKYVIFLNAEECKCPNQFDSMPIIYYINHSHTPNIITISENSTIAVKDILAGEEILFDYNQLDEPEKFKEDYYKTTN